MVAALVLASQFAGAQEATTAEAEETSVETATAVPDSFNDLRLGMEIEEIKTRLKNNSNFLYRGDPDVSLLSQPNETLIDAKGFSYINRGYFQFYDKKLYTIILELDDEKMDHFTMYTALVEKYGDPSSLSPTAIVWDFENVSLSLERPLSLKYVDKTAFNTILSLSEKAESLNQITREVFLDQF
jgi:hypothetical protein